MIKEIPATYLPKRIISICSALFFLMLSACGNPSALHAHDVAGHLPDLDFSLTSDLNEPVSAATYRGATVLLYFGFTHCADQCPVALAHIAHILQTLGPNGRQVRILFVSLDARHDTPPVLHRYVASFDALHMTGLTGDEREILRLVKRYRTVYRLADDREDSDDIPHSNAIYMFDGNGHARFLMDALDKDQQLATGIRLLSDTPQASTR